MPRRSGGLAALLALCAAATASALAAAPEVLRGEQLYARCAACHALASDRVGPRHCGLLGRRAGSVPGFVYSPAMKKSGLVWDEKTLSRFLAKPMAVVPGTRMTYDGVPDAKERGELIAYLKAANGEAPCK
ncbi:c-type cytochrome [Polaromonas sp. SM01]|uniref:c-type cytochrome n=1 Tax=Polaromonas sp. SM01 TaxID=3085630 RepID=UPI002980BBCC|nr:c-type cytochrome [Polaromonas sp. SM01]MDW5443421.1 c-type cytochrome [Polaromonas sp. SM01]